MDIMSSPVIVAQMVKNLPTVKETPVPSLGREDPLEKEVATHSSILAWRIPLTEEPGGPQSMEWQRYQFSSVTQSCLMIWEPVD